MDSEANWAQNLEILKKYWIPLALGTLGLILFIYGLISFLGTGQREDIVPFSQEKTASNRANSITVDIEGAIIKPGVYKLESGSIIQDALVLSQGLSEEADRDYVAKNINLAQKLIDGEKIYIPREGETPVAQVIQTSSSTSQTALLNINTASESELDGLPGVGPVTSEKIINGRPYSKIEDLLNRKIVSSKVFLEIKDKIVCF